MKQYGFILIPIIIIALLVTGAIAVYEVSNPILHPSSSTTQPQEATSSTKQETPSLLPSTATLFVKTPVKIQPTPTPKPTPIRWNPTPTPFPKPTPTPAPPELQSSVKIDSITPNPAKFGDTVTLRGSGFGSFGQQVLFTNSLGYTTGAPVLSRSDSEIKVNVPPSKGEVMVQVEDASGVKSNAYSLQVTSGQPYFGSISPSNVKPGGEIVITGREFGNRSGVVNFYHGNSISSSAGGSVIYSWSNTLIKANVPGIIAPNQEYGIQIVTSDGRVSSFKYYQVGN